MTPTLPSITAPATAIGGTSTANGGSVYVLNTGDVATAGRGAGINWLAAGIVAGCGLLLWYYLRRGAR